MAKKPNPYADRPYAVGKGKPPVNTRFGNGQPTNRGGRSKSVESADTTVHAALAERIKVTINGRRRSITKYAASVMQVVNRSAQGDLAAFRVVQELKRELEDKADPIASQPLSADDRAFLNDLAENLMARGSPNNE